ncbi:transmembrane protease serine 9-like [Hyposmocoma kahamanoa]|uniref:transmembrane protease serine 9-like n=1 Tax=Hyposmocoma kahamanoa TaxID=1477025 RepID=UPI000E6D8F72|nr:transmembrane protease serine 9-like [Hyposmocoma kahamanoa]
MKFAILTLLLVSAYAQARSFEPKGALGLSAYGYLQKSVIYAEERRKAEEAYLNNQRIIGGSAAVLGQFPYQAGIHLEIAGITGVGVCGGTLVSETRIITAAHCWFDGFSQVITMSARLGTVLLFGNDGITTPKTNQVIMHPDWFPAMIRNDVAVMYLPNAVTLSNTLYPIRLPSGSELEEDFTGELTIISGYGLTNVSSGVSETLRYVSVSVMSNEECIEFYNPALLLPTNICTSGAGVVGACSSDSGGPLAFTRNNRTILIGVVSFGSTDGCMVSHPTAYGRFLVTVREAKMKLTVLTLLVVAACTQASSIEAKDVLTSAYGYLERSLVYTEEKRKVEEEYLANQRIIGGVPAALGQYPWQAGLLLDIVGLDGMGVCGASLISASRLVTAAHCWWDGLHQVWRVTVRLGTVMLFGNDGVTLQTSVVVPSPNWFPALARNDIAVIYLTNSVPISNNIAPISLPTGSEIEDSFAGRLAIASGFGLTSAGGGIGQDQNLQHVRLSVMENSVCQALFIPTLVQPTNICTSGVGSVGACGGDSGGPLSITLNGRNVLIGVVSFGPPPPLTCESSFPTVYARVTSFVDFLNQHLD